MLDASGTSQRRPAAALREVELAIAKEILHAANASANAQIKDLTEAARSADLFGRRSGLSREQRATINKLRRRQLAIDRAHEALARGTVPFFSFEVHAPDVIARGGFSAVFGNPPWVRAERLEPGRRRALSERFSTWRVAPSQRLRPRLSGYAHQPDLSVAFLERALELAAPGGAIGLLLPSKFLSGNYGEAARRTLVAETRIECVHCLPPREAARFGATTYPVAVVVKRDPPPAQHRVSVGFGQKPTVSQKDLNRPGPWVMVPDRTRRALDEFLSAGSPLSRWAPPALGVKTGADAIFVGTVVAQNSATSVVRFGSGEVRVESQLLRPALRGRDVRSFSVTPAKCLVWTHDDDGRVRQSLPRLVAAYLRGHAGNLRRRSDHRSGPLWSLFRTGAATARSRVVRPDIAKSPRAVALDETNVPRAIPLNTCYVAAVPDRETALVMAAVLNSTWSYAVAVVMADEARGGYRRLNARVAGSIPLPGPGRAQRDPRSWA